MQSTLTLSADDVRDIISAHLQAQGYQPVGEVKLQVGTELRGHGTNEHPVSVFRGARVDIKAAPVKLEAPNG